MIEDIRDYIKDTVKVLRTAHGRPKWFSGSSEDCALDSRSCDIHLPRVRIQVAPQCGLDAVVTHHPADGVQLHSGIRHRCAVESPKGVAARVNPRLLLQMPKCLLDVLVGGGSPYQSAPVPHNEVALRRIAVGIEYRCAVLHVLGYALHYGIGNLFCDDLSLFSSALSADGHHIVLDVAQFQSGNLIPAETHPACEFDYHLLGEFRRMPKDIPFFLEYPCALDGFEGPDQFGLDVRVLPVEELDKHAESGEILPYGQLSVVRHRFLRLAYDVVVDVLRVDHPEVIENVGIGLEEGLAVTGQRHRTQSAFLGILHEDVDQTLEVLPLGRSAVFLPDSFGTAELLEDIGPATEDHEFVEVIDYLAGIVFRQRGHKARKVLVALLVNLTDEQDLLLLRQNTAAGCNVVAFRRYCGGLVFGALQIRFERFQLFLDWIHNPFSSSRDIMSGPVGDSPLSST